MKRSWRKAGWCFAAAVVFFGSAAGIAGAADKGPVKIGIVPSQSVKALIEQYQPLMDYLGRKVGQPFELLPTKTYDELVRKLKSGEIDGGVAGSFVADRAIREIGAVPVARPEKKGVSTYRGLVVVRKDSGFRKIEDLKGKTFDFVSPDTSAGYVFPKALLREKKLDPETFFSKTSFAGKHDVAISKVLNREIDGAAVKDAVFDKVSANDPRVNAELIIIARSDRFPEGTIVFRKGAPGDVVKAVRQALLGLSGAPSGKAALDAVGADRYIETSAKDFAYLENLRKDLGLK